MKITRRYHSCVELSEGQTSVIIDPGSFEVPENLAEVDAVLVTHIHPDHVDAAALTAARGKNPQLAVYGPAELAGRVDFPYTTVRDGDTFEVGALHIAVHESAHGTVTHSTPLPENLGFLINGRVLHTGDSFPELDGVEVALVPVSAPWLKMLDVEDYLRTNRPTRFIGVHDGIDNDFGLNLRRRLLGALAEEHSLEYLPLRPGESVEV
ncbi:MBL fold metallo-hydrolase [Corynebacterium sp. YIM 101645]|uniref:MBL fold metallo-hydrolase n=1 Tax=Corynebacterium lemuris TaxID=1859292 RepID=A0ABT2FVL4_9CORY|nr:MBL fold metallo-hydrolase [Corynebacterium lemuris]MCS5478820.1 MBL fold metallo-hydrolase [Corynebacterium lemuris]